MGAVQFKGAALGAWFEFVKANRKSVYEQAVRVKGSTKDKKGKVEFHVPIFSLVKLSEDSNKEATFLDVQLQEYLRGYLERTRINPPPTSERPQPDAAGDDDQELPAGPSLPEPEPEPESGIETPGPDNDIPF
jgi:hypothetical protein